MKVAGRASKGGWGGWPQGLVQTAGKARAWGTAQRLPGGLWSPTFLNPCFQTTSPPPRPLLSCHSGSPPGKRGIPLGPVWGPGLRPKDIPNHMKPWGRDDLSPKWEVQLVSHPWWRQASVWTSESRKRPSSLAL